MGHRVLALASGLALVAACFEPDIPACSFRCEAGGTCPLGLTCGEDGFCRDEAGTCPCVGCVSGGSYNYAFVSSEQYLPGELGGVAGADGRCNELAGAAGLPGQYVAWLSTIGPPSVPAPTRLGSANGWIRTDGRPFAVSRVDLLGGAVLNPLGLDEAGLPSTGTVVATGTLYDGGVSTNTAGDWQDTTLTAPFEAGDTTATTTWWLGGGWNAATTRAHIYCFGIDHDRPLVIEPWQGRRAFVSGETPLLDRDAADAACQAEAAGLGGSFKALLSTSDEAAAARFDRSGRIWVRLDGIPWVVSAADLDGGAVLTTLNVDRDGRYLGQVPVWTGGQEPGSIASANCADWTDPTGVAVFGAANYVRHFFAFDEAACDTPRALYCLEE